MIGFLKGEIEQAQKGFILIKTKMGIGYLVKTTKKNSATLLAKKKGGEIFVHTQYSRDGKINLFGFLDWKTYTMFLLLIKISDIGPQKALTILDKLGASELEEIIFNGDVELLENYGVSKKVAEKLVLELNSKIKKAKIDTKQTKDLFTTLLSLDYTPKEARAAIEHIQDREADIEGQLKEALKYFQIKI